MGALTDKEKESDGDEVEEEEVWRGQHVARSHHHQHLHLIWVASHQQANPSRQHPGAQEWSRLDLHHIMELKREVYADAYENYAAQHQDNPGARESHQERIYEHAQKEGIAEAHE